MQPVIPSTQRAIIQAEEPGTLTLVNNRPVPSLAPNQVLVKTAAVALNPCDWKMPTNFPCPGAGVGSDYAGTVVALGSDVHASTGLKVGDRVAGAVHASNRLDPQTGSFAEYVSVCADQLWRVPANMSWADAAAIGWCVLGTVGLALYRALDLPGTPEHPTDKPTFVLVNGGSTASGTMAIQILKLSGFRVIATSRPANFPLVLSYGAEAAFDYASPACADEIRAHTGGNLRYAVDIIADAKSLKLCYAAIGRGGGRYVGFELIPEELAAARKTVKTSWVLGIRMSGNEIALDRGYGSAADPELRKFGCELFRRMEALIADGKLRPHPVVANERGGLDGVIGGVEKLRRREVSGFKVVSCLGGGILDWVRV